MQADTDGDAGGDTDAANDTILERLWQCVFLSLDDVQGAVRESAQALRSRRLVVRVVP